MAKITTQAIIAAGVLSFFITAIWMVVIGNPLGFWFEWAGWFTCILCVYYKWL